MLQTRFSTPNDVTAQRRLWKLAFGDTDEYLDNFYLNYYRPQRAIVLEEDGEVRAMFTWFDTTLTLSGGRTYRAAYVYALATHPDCRGRGLAARLLAEGGELLRPLGVDLLTTVPAEPSLHSFFAANGFEEAFVMDQWESAPLTAEGKPCALTTASPAGYNTAREGLLNAVPHITFPNEALAHQLRCCQLSGGGGLFTAVTGHGPACLCAERSGENTLIVKEVLGCKAAKRDALEALSVENPRDTLIIRTVLGTNPVETVRFGMLKWLNCTNTVDCGALECAFLGLAFD